MLRDPASAPALQCGRDRHELGGPAEQPACLRTDSSATETCGALSRFTAPRAPTLGRHGAPLTRIMADIICVSCSGVLTWRSTRLCSPAEAASAALPCEAHLAQRSSLRKGYAVTSTLKSASDNSEWHHTTHSAVHPVSPSVVRSYSNTTKNPITNTCAALS